jgi:hypothetical protein
LKVLPGKKHDREIRFGDVRSLLHTEGKEEAFNLISASWPDMLFLKDELNF